MKWPLVMNEWGSACYFLVITHPGGSLDYGAGMTSCSWLLYHHIWNVIFCLLRFFFHVHAKVHSLLFPFHNWAPSFSCLVLLLLFCKMQYACRGIGCCWFSLEVCGVRLLRCSPVVVIQGVTPKALFSSWKGTWHFSSNTKQFSEMKLGFKARHQIDTQIDISLTIYLDLLIFAAPLECIFSMNASFTILIYQIVLNVFFFKDSSKLNFFTSRILSYTALWMIYK